MDEKKLGNNLQVNILSPRPGCGCEGGLDAGLYVEKGPKGDAILVAKVKCTNCGARQTIPFTQAAVRWMFEKEPV
jgi:hypothetical protein